MIRTRRPILLLAALGCMIAGAQLAAAQAPHGFEVGGFGGFNAFNANRDTFKTDLVNGGTIGSSFSFLNWDKLSFEVLSAYGTNNFRFRTSPTSTLDFGSRTLQTMLNPVYHFANRDKRIRPYITFGIGVNSYRPTDDAKSFVSSLTDPLLKASMASLRTTNIMTFNYGGGVKIKFKPNGNLALRLDVRGILSDNPKFGLATTPQPGGVFIDDGKLYGVQSTVGIIYSWGKAAVKTVANVPPPAPQAPPPPPPPPPPPAPAPQNVITVSDIQNPGGPAAVCAGSPVNLSVTNSSTFPVRYQWNVNGTAVGTNQNSYMFNAPDAGGDQRVSVQVTDASGSARSAQPVTRNLSVPTRAYARPTIQTALAGGTEVRRGDVVNVTATGGGDCGGPLNYTWTASDGTITPSAQSPLRATFNTATMNFGPAADRDELKQVNLVATVRDGRGATATSQTSVTVRKVAEFVRLPDILFNSKSSTVNNCGKRILLDEVFPRVRSANYTIVLVGHTDESEKGVANLDRERAYSAARVLVSGADTQVRVEPARVKADWTGTTQTAAKSPGYCGTSTRPAVAERTGAAVRQADTAAENRRVEVWLVPTGVSMPPGVNAKDLPATIRPKK